MARIPTRGGREVFTEIDPQPFQKNLREDAFGGEVGAAAQKFATAGEVIIANNEEDDSRRKAKDLENAYRQEVLKLEFGDGTPDNPGYYGTQGGAAVDGYAGFEAASQKLRQDMSDGIANRKVKSFFDNASGTLMVASLEGGQRHSLSQRQAANTQASAARIASASNDAAIKWKDPKFVESQRVLVHNEVLVSGARTGAEPAVVEELMEEAMSNFYLGVITMAAKENTAEGKRLFDEHRESLKPGAFAKADALIEDYEELDEINKESALIMSTPNITRTEAREMARTIEDPDVQKGVLHQITKEFEAQKADRIEAERVVTDEAFADIQAGKTTWAEIQRNDPERAAAINSIPGLPEQLRGAETQRIKGEEFATGVHTELVQAISELPPDQLMKLGPATLKGRLNEQETADVFRLQKGIREGLAKTEGSRATYDANQAALKETKPKGFDWLDKDASETEIIRAHQLSNEMAAWRSDYIEANAKQPSAQEVQNQAAALWQKTGGNDYIPWNEKQGTDIRNALTAEQQARYLPDLDDLDEDFVRGITNDLRQRGFKKPTFAMVQHIAGAMMMADYGRVHRILGSARLDLLENQAATAPRRPLQETVPAEVGKDLQALAPETEEAPVVEETPAPATEEAPEPEAKAEPQTPSDAFAAKIAQIESSGNPEARAKTSSATGLYQFIDDTWLEEIKQHAPEETEGRTQEEILELRTDPEISTKVFKGFTLDNARGLQSSGIEVSERNLYLAHFLGLGGARSALKQAPHKPVPLAVQRANPHLAGKDIQFLLDWAESKIRG